MPMISLCLVKSIHHPRVLIRQRHIRVDKQIGDIPSLLVPSESEKYVVSKN